MKIKIPAKEVEACDICGSTGWILTKCVCCGKEYCHICEAIIMGCIHQPDICKQCADNDAVTAVVDRFAKKLSLLLKYRDKATKAATAKGK